MGAYGEMILTWVHMGNLYSHMHHVKLISQYAPMLNVFLQNSKKFQKILGEIITKILKNYKNFEIFFNMGAYGEMILTWVHMGNLYSHMHHVKYFFLQNSKKFQKIFWENITKILKNYKNFEIFFSMGAYGQMILTWVHMGNLYSHMHHVKFISP